MVSTILLAVDHAILREGIRAVISTQQDLKVIGHATTGPEAVVLARQYCPDVVVIDIFLSELNGAEATRRILRADPKARVVVISGLCENQYAWRMLEAGASAYVQKTAGPDELLRAVRAALAGERYLAPGSAPTNCRSPLPSLANGNLWPNDILTSREREVLQLIAEGMTTRQIATHLGIAECTVHVHRQRVKQKLELRNVAQLTRFAIREGLTTAYA